MKICNIYLQSFKLSKVFERLSSDDLHIGMRQIKAVQLGVSWEEFWAIDHRDVVVRKIPAIK